MPAGAQRFAWRRWGENGVVFDRRYGDTHTLSGVAASLFQAWLSADSTALDVLARHIGELAASPAPTLPQLAEALQDLQQRGLLPPSAPAR